MGNYKEHLLVGFFTTGAILVILYLINRNLDFLLDPILLTTLTIVTLIFSLLPDIDHKSSQISGFLHFVSVLAVLAVITGIIKIDFSSILILLFLAGLEIYHWHSAKNNWEHRQFPHSLTFGFFALIVLFLMTFSWLAVLVGAATFVSHLILDNYLDKAIGNDKLFWKKIGKKLRLNTNPNQ